MQRGAADKLFINTAGMGAIPADIHWGAQTLSIGDVLLVSGTLGDHGATILNLREQLGLDGELASDCAVLTPLIQTLRHIDGVKALRDATRGGVNAVAHDLRRPAVTVLNCPNPHCRSNLPCAASASCWGWMP
ncbi:[NiFe] hydrogenase metallocenter assemblyprotein HypE [Salmonella enterica subsp. enterica]|uniref:[NiFe] hydrogenase metallocenter assemblyprotein HypE n=1 Tax=Salmonella enterica I TaxID=59201 RepID=A0A379W449_SALET|nr:[NiFe] hydrogenase metallocenter assemblyprotein HypE [Salmonella enterica subsp. enterica]